MPVRLSNHMPSDAKNIPIVRILVSAKRIHSSLLAERTNAHRWNVIAHAHSILKRSVAVMNNAEQNCTPNNVFLSKRKQLNAHAQYTNVR